MFLCSCLSPLTTVSFFSPLQEVQYGAKQKGWDFASLYGFFRHQYQISDSSPNTKEVNGISFFWRSQHAYLKLTLAEFKRTSQWPPVWGSCYRAASVGFLPEPLFVASHIHLRLIKKQIDYYFSRKYSH